uniref:DNA polymerase n=1 Tax=Strongyloides stercoralis TaxID=6248 RepID=A0AAF5DCN8_STRER
MSSSSDDEIVINRSAKRSNRSLPKNNKIEETLAKIREAKAGGTKYKPNIDVKDVYETIDEEEYQKIVNERQKNAFVVGDEGHGYWNEEEDDFLSENDLDEEKEKNIKTKKNKKVIKSGIKNYFNTVSKEKVKDNIAVKFDEDEVLKDLLKELDGDEEKNDPVVAEPQNRNPFKRHLQSPIENEKPIKTPKIVSTPIKVNSPVNQQECIVKKDVVTPVKSATVEIVADDGPKDIVMKDISLKTGNLIMDDFDESLDNSMFEEEKVNKNKSDKVLNLLETEELVEQGNLPDSEDFTEHQEEVDIVEGFTENVGINETQDENSTTITMHFVDAFEDPIKHPSDVYLFGRIQKVGGYNKSVCVKLYNIESQVFFIPRLTRVVNGNNTNVEVKMTDVYEEVKNILLKNYNIPTFKSRVVKKRLAFEDEEWNNKEIDCLEVRYNAKLSRLPTTMNGETFFKVCNTTSSALERILLECKIMGPSIIEIKNVAPVDSKVSYCNLEYTCDMEKMGNISNVENSKSIPTTTKLISFNILTELNKNNESEIVMINGVFDLTTKNNIDKTKSYLEGFTRFCFMTVPFKASIPFNWKSKCISKGIRNIECLKNEREVIIKFLEFLEKHDFDLYVGHDFAEQLSKLVTRLYKLKISQWSRISRLKRTVDIYKVGFSKASQWELTCGRLIADSRIAAMELLKAKAYDLDDLVEQLFGEKRDLEFMNGRVGENYATPDALANFINKCIKDSFYSIRIIAKLDVIPLFAQMTRIVGGIFSRTLLGGRSERNEYLLLHAFYNRNYITPDKHSKTSLRATKKENDDSDNVKKTTFSGGMVLEPLKGLYDTYVILLDFNSLYPSIIQEYNICFTTISNCRKEPEDENNLPKAPGSDKQLGILPIEISKLVECRRAVKLSLNKTKNLDDFERKKLEIKQMALKLTANSMYGCLGFNASRFCAKTLAALVTFKGREILLSTKNLVERSGFRVIYGDTDSIMINSNSHSLKEAKEIAMTVKKMVNKCYKNLEIDLDGVYKKLLLLKKKKYAGLSVNPNNENDVKRELKGLDIVRRDWSVLVKETGDTIIDLIFSKDRDDLNYEILSMLGSLKNKLNNMEIGLDKFEIFKQLTKNPTEYNDAKGQAHVSVALRLNKVGLTRYKAGDVVKYIICVDGTTNSAPQRAYHKKEFENFPKLKVDVEYYLKQQLSPVIRRLCEPIKEIDPIQIDESLGLDTTALRNKMLEKNDSIDNDDIDATFEQDFDSCKSFTFNCPNPECMVNIEIRAPIITFGNITRLSLEQCCKCDCNFIENKGYITNCLTEQLRKQIKEYCTSPYVCDDETCTYQSQRPPIKMSKHGPLCIKCENGIMKKKYSIKKLYDQQCFFRNIFDIEHAISRGLITPEIRQQLENNNNYLDI